MRRSVQSLLLSLLAGALAASCSNGSTPANNCGDIACPDSCSLSADCNSCVPVTPGAGLGNVCALDTDCCTGYSCVNLTCAVTPDGGLTEGGSSGSSGGHGGSSGGSTGAASTSGGAGSTGGVSGCTASATPNTTYDAACNPTGGSAEVCNASGVCVANCNDGTVACGPGTTCQVNGHCLPQGGSSGSSGSSGGSTGSSSTGGTSTGGGSTAGGSTSGGSTSGGATSGGATSGGSTSGGTSGGSAGSCGQTGVAACTTATKSTCCSQYCYEDVCACNCGGGTYVCTTAADCCTGSSTPCNTPSTGCSGGYCQ